MKIVLGSVTKPFAVKWSELCRILNHQRLSTDWKECELLKFYDSFEVYHDDAMQYENGITMMHYVILQMSYLYHSIYSSFQIITVIALSS